VQHATIQDGKTEIKVAKAVMAGRMQPKEQRGMEGRKEGKTKKKA
jgi:hypothetical protein